MKRLVFLTFFAVAGCNYIADHVGITGGIDQQCKSDGSCDGKLVCMPHLNGLYHVCQLPEEKE